MTRSHLLAATAAAALALAGCNRNDADQTTTNAAATLPDLPATLPLTVGSASVIANAPQANALPEAKSINLVRARNPGDAYAYADRAYGFAEALGDAPPDYGFDYDGVEPWAWQAYDDSVSFAEPIDGGYRYYYYRPGAETPYFVRDPYYGYGYDDGALAAVYAADGSIVPYEDYGPRLDYASRYWVRGRDLWATSRRSERRSVIAANWAARDAMIEGSRARWFESRRNQPDWAAYAAANDPRREAYWRAEDVRREADARRFARWRQEDFRTPPPPRAIPSGWREARWARDPQRYAPAAAGPREGPADVARGPGGPGFDHGPHGAGTGGPGFERGPADAGPDGRAERSGAPDARRGRPERIEAPGPGGPDRGSARQAAAHDARPETHGRPDATGRPDRGGPGAAERRPERGAPAEAARAGPAAARSDRGPAAAGRPERGAPGAAGRGPAPAVARADRGGGASAPRGGERSQAGGGPGGGGSPPAGRPDGGAPHGKPGGPR